MSISAHMFTQVIHITKQSMLHLAVANLGNFMGRQALALLPNACCKMPVMLVSKAHTACCVSFMLSLSAVKNSRRTSTKSSCTHMAWSSSSQVSILRHDCLTMQSSKLSWTDALLVKNGSHLTVMQFSNLSCKTHTPGTVVLGGDTTRHIMLNSTCVNVVTAATARDFMTVTKQSCDFMKSGVLADPC